MHWDVLVRIYEALKRLYDTLLGLIALLGCAGFLTAVAVPQPEASAAQRFSRCFGAAALFLVPIWAHHTGAMFLMLRQHFFAGIGFLASGAACCVPTLFPAVGAAMATLPLAGLYRPVMLVLAVALPFAIWIAILVVVWRGRNTPFGDLFFG